MRVTRRIVRKWHSLRLYELQHQHDNAYLFAEDDADLEQMRQDLWEEACRLYHEPKMEIPPDHFIRECYAGLV